VEAGAEAEAEERRREVNRLDKILEALKALEKDEDTEDAHIDADTLLAEAVSLLGRPDIAEAFNAVGKWYS
jgi:hypothetical protein